MNPRSSKGERREKVWGWDSLEILDPPHPLEGPRRPRRNPIFGTKRDVRQRVSSSFPLEPSPTLQGITRFSW